MGKYIHIFKTQAEYEDNKQNITPPFIAHVKENNKMGMHADKTVETLFNFQRKSVNINENGSFTIEPDSSYGALSSVNVKVNVPTSNGPTGGGVSKSLNDITYYDYDGTVLYSYTKDEFLALTNHPELPSRPGLICQGWNYEFTKAQEYVTKYGMLNIGATYITDDGKTRLYIKIAAEGRMDVPLYFSQTAGNGVIIDWGDGSATQTLSGTGNKNTTHKYANIGEYCITLSVRSGCTLGLGHGYSIGVMGGISNYENIYCNMLQRVEIGERVASIGTYAFNSCYSLTSIVIPESVTIIGSYAFENCYSIASIVIPESVTNIGAYTFSSCCSLASIVIPDSVTSIGNYAFEYCYSFTSIVIPDSVTSIGNYAFSRCYFLASIVIPECVANIGSYAFQYCYSLTSVIIPESVTSIGNYVFYLCYSLTSVVIPESVTSIGNYAFSDCYSLTSIVIPESVTIIGNYAFQSCRSLTSVIIPESVTNIGTYAFSSCYSFASIVIPESVTNIGGYAFQNCYSLTSIVIPESVTSIGSSTFGRCYSLASIVIPESVTNIGSYAFTYCYGMAFYDFSILTTVPSLSATSAFTDIPSDCKIIVPDALYDEWITATNWSAYASYIIKKSDWDAL